MFSFKERIAGNSTAIAKPTLIFVGNAETGHFGRKIRVHESIRASLRFDEVDDGLQGQKIAFSPETTDHTHRDIGKI